jgi:hypothetical protein
VKGTYNDSTVIKPFGKRCPLMGAPVLDSMHHVAVFKERDTVPSDLEALTLRVG